MKVSVKTIHTLQIERDSINQNIRRHIIEDLKDLCEDESLESLHLSLNYCKALLMNALEGNYARIFSDGNTAICLNEEEFNFIDNFLTEDKKQDVELVIEIVDEGVLIDKVREVQIDY